MSITSDSLWSCFEARARDAGNIEAILAPARASLAFADLPERLISIRDALARYGITRGDRVAAVLPRGPETAVCYLGVAACATYMPLNPDFTEAELSAYMKLLRPKAVIVPSGSAHAARRSAEALGVAAIELAIDMANPAGSFSLSCPSFSGQPSEPAWNDANDIALVLLTSGSTSEPKAVPLAARHLLAYAHASKLHYGLSHADRCLHVMPMFHGHGLKSSLFVPLANGSGVICPRDFDIPSFFQQMQTFRPTWYSAASSIHHAILEGIEPYRGIARDARLRFIRSGSARLDPKVMAGLEHAFGAPVVERYGMSECGTLTANCLPPGLRKPGTAGKAMGNEVAVIDDTGRQLPPGHMGEVVTRGASVFDGYLDNPAANAAAFIDGWFRTGDLGRFDGDGYLTLVGRVKDVINRGGEKIATAEIESAIVTHPAIAESCAFAIPHPSLGEEVAAAVVAKPGHAVTEPDIRAHARTLLTNVKIPRRIFVLESLPKGATKKVRRDQVRKLCLELLAQSQSPPSDNFAQWSALEQKIANAWMRVLKLKTIDRNDDFFLIGGDSLKAYELIAFVRKTFSVALDLQQIFDQAGTIAGMANLVGDTRRSQRGPQSAYNGLIAIKGDGDWPPLFAVPGSDGNPVEYIHLGRLIESRQPLIGIEARGLDGDRPPLARVEEIASDNIMRMRAMQPKGPYFLTGACFGGRVAYEMGRQLEMAGEKIGLLLLLDPSSPFFNAKGRARGGTYRPPNRFLLAKLIAERLVMHCAELFTSNGSGRRAFIREKLATLRGMIEQRDPFRGDRSELHRRAVYAANRAAGRRYVPGTFGGPAVLCFTRERKVRGPRNFRLDWLPLLPQAGDVIYTSGRTSGEMLVQPYVYELAGIVNNCLRKCHADETLTAQTSAAHLLSAE